MRILMTGSHGFVGTNLISALSDKYEIVRWDVRSDDPLPEVDAFIHLAGKAHDTKQTTEASEYFRVNTYLTKKIFDKFLKSSAKIFIFFSSIKAQDGDTAYARSKKLAEDYILETVYGSGLMDHGDKQYYILRPCMIHGKGVKGNLPLLFKYVKKGWPWPLAAFENRRSFASMGNIAFVVDRLMSSEVESGIYNVCDDEAISTNELIGLICECLGKKAHLWKIPKEMMKGMAKIGDTLHLPLNSERLKKLTENNVIDNSEIKRVLSISHMPIKAMEGLKVSIRELLRND